MGLFRKECEECPREALLINYQGKNLCDKCVARNKNPEGLSKDLNKLGMDLENYDETRISAENKRDIINITQDLHMSGYWKGTALFTNPSDSAIIGLLRALVSQNWILIRQNKLLIDKMNKKIRNEEKRV